MKWTSWVTAAALLLVIGIVVWSSLQIGGVRCEVCIRFNGREACRAVDGNTREDAKTAAVTNTCALLASGVTQTLACEHTEPAKLECRP